MSSTVHLLDSPLFTLPWNSKSEAEQLKISYDRSRLIGRAYQFTVSDVVNLTPKFWEFHRDNICAFDICAFSLVTIQCNLVAGTIAQFIQEQPEHRQLLHQILNFDVNAQFLLTELGHGLDAKNLETTATLLDNGSLDLHTPHANAAKYMPPTSPVQGHPRVGLVVARLVVGNQDRGVRAFVVTINDGNSMSPGITCRVLPRRAGSKMVDHSLTTFNHVNLPRSSLLGSLDMPVNRRDQFSSVISRISVGTLAISTTMLPILKRCVFVAGKYSLRRQITGPNGLPIPIVSFRTQQAPILHALANIAVFDVWAKDCQRRFCDMSLETRVRHGVATAFKAVVTKASQDSLYVLAERCGAQGIYEHNHIIESQLESRGISISEGDTLTLCIRLASEILLDRYSLPPPENSGSLLALREASVFEECRSLLRNMSEGHRSQEFDHVILPRCQYLVESAGQRMAFEAAIIAGVPSDLLALYEAGLVRQDSAWFVEKGRITRETQFEMECRALDAALPLLDRLLDELDVGRYCTAPVLSESLMNEFNDNLTRFEGKGVSECHEDFTPQSKL